MILGFSTSRWNNSFLSPFMKSVWVQLIFSLEVVEQVFENKNHGGFIFCYILLLKGFE